MVNKKTKLIIGLGNPGKDYNNTRHNIGFAVLDGFAFKQGLSFKKEKKFEAEVVMGDFIVEYSLKTKSNKNTDVNSLPEKLPDARISSDERNAAAGTLQVGCKLILAKPITFMNNSGRAVTKLAQFYKIATEDILVIHDDVSMDTGKLRMAFERGAGGQHGVEDIIANVGKKFHRLKLGVGPDPGGEIRADYVLSSFPKKEKKLVDTMTQEAIELIIKWLSELEDIQQIETIRLVAQ